MVEIQGDSGGDARAPGDCDGQDGGGGGIGYRNGGRVQGGVGIQPMSQERIHGGGKQGRASVNRSPDSCGIHSLIGAIDTPRRLL